MDSDKITLETLKMIVEYLGGEPESGKVKFWTELAEKLSRIVGQEPTWTWRYPQSIYKQTKTNPSRLFTHAVMALGAAMDETPAVMVYTVQVRVYAKPGTVENGSVLLGSSQPCKRPGCKVRIVPKVPWGKYCSPECRDLDKKSKRVKNGPKVIKTA